MREIVGIVSNVHDGPLDRAPQPAMYVPAALEHTLAQSTGVPVARVPPR
jgi:hypothetical protein